MITKRIMEHMRQQHWTAVFIELAIVVLGVFIGLQANNWNEARHDRETEALYLERLQLEIAEILPKAEAAYDDVRKRFGLLVEVRNYFATGKGGDALGPGQCSAIRGSHIFAATIFYPPTIKELVATGRIILIRDDSLRTAILSFDQANEQSSQLRTDIQIDRLPLARKYPYLLKQSLSSWEDVSCDFKAMAGDRPFLNDFIDNSRRYEAYVDDVVGRQVEILKSLGVTVKSALGEAPMAAPGQTGQQKVPGEGGKDK